MTQPNSFTFLQFSGDTTFWRILQVIQDNVVLSSESVKLLVIIYGLHFLCYISSLCCISHIKHFCCWYKFKSDFILLKSCVCVCLHTLPGCCLAFIPGSLVATPWPLGAIPQVFAHFDRTEFMAWCLRCLIWGMPTGSRIFFTCHTWISVYAQPPS